MANTLKHKFASTQADSADTALVRPISNWNAEHVYAGGANGQILVRDSAQTDGYNWSGGKAPNIPANAVIAAGLTIPAPVITGMLTDSTFNAGDVTPTKFVGRLTTISTDAATTGTVKQTLASYSLPANSLSANAKGVRILALFTTAANANSKTVTIDFGGTTIASVTTTTSANAMVLDAYVVDISGSSELAMSTSYAQAGTTASFLSLAIATTAAITIAATATTPTAAGDATFRGMVIEMVS